MTTGLPSSLALASAALFLLGCQAPQPPQPTYNLESSEDLFRSDQTLTPGEQEQVLALMRAAVPCDTPVVIAPARYGVRWNDLDGAVRWGSSLVEMAVLSVHHEPAVAANENTATTPERMIFRVITAADDPVTLTVTREPPPTIYSMSASAGLFGNRIDLEEQLLREVRAAMLLYGAKPLPTTLDD